MNNNNLHDVKLKSQFQWYFMKDLVTDINKIIKQDIRIINLFTEPISTLEIVNLFKKRKIFRQKKSRS